MGRDPPELHQNHYWFDASPMRYPEDMPLIKHSLTYKNDPYPVLLQFTKVYSIQMCKIHRIHCLINTLKISINRITESIVVVKSISNVTACFSFFVRYLIENDFL